MGFPEAKGEKSDTIAAFKGDGEEVSDMDDEEDAYVGSENKINFLNDIGLLAELSKMSMTEELGGKVIDGHERYNVNFLA